MGFFTSRNKFDIEGKTVLLTGASQGMGLSVASLLSKKGASIILVSRNKNPLKEALNFVKSVAKDSSTQRFLYISADVTKPEENVRVVQEVVKWNNDIAPDVVWCMAGGAYPHLFLETSTEQLEQQMDLNYWSCVYMAQAILPAWLHHSEAEHDKAALNTATERYPRGQSKEKGTRHLVFTSSVVAFCSLAGYSPYAPAKAAIRSLSDTLVQELLLYNHCSSNDPNFQEVKIHTVFPGSISSPGFAVENEVKPAITKLLEESDPIQSPDEVARKAVEGLEKGEYLVTVGWLGAAMRATAWGISERNSWVYDSLMIWFVGIASLFMWRDLKQQITGFAKKIPYLISRDKIA